MRSLSASPIPCNRRSYSLFVVYWGWQFWQMAGASCTTCQTSSNTSAASALPRPAPNRVLRQSILELVGGVLLALGLGSRLIALMLTCNMTRCLHHRRSRGVAFHLLRPRQLLRRRSVHLPHGVADHPGLRAGQVFAGLPHRTVSAWTLRFASDVHARRHPPAMAEARFRRQRRHRIHGTTLFREDFSPSRMLLLSIQRNMPFGHLLSRRVILMMVLVACAIVAIAWTAAPPQPASGPATTSIFAALPSTFASTEKPAQRPATTCSPGSAAPATPSAPTTANFPCPTSASTCMFAEDRASTAASPIPTTAATSPSHWEPTRPSLNSMTIGCSPTR